MCWNNCNVNETIPCAFWKHCAMILICALQIKGIDADIQCGFIHKRGSDSFQLNVYERQKIDPEKFKSISVNFSGASVIVSNKNCFIRICGFTYSSNVNNVTSILRKSVGYCEDFYDTQDPTVEKRYNLDFEVTSISCGCYNLKECDIFGCSTNATCATLFEEDSCADCYNQKPIHIDDGSTFLTESSAFVKSFQINKQCCLHVTTFGSLNDNFQEPRTESYEKSLNFFHTDKEDRGSPLFHKDGQVYYCFCPKMSSSSTTSLGTTHDKNATPTSLTTQVIISTTTPSMDTSTSKNLNDITFPVGIFLGVAIITIVVVFVLRHVFISRGKQNEVKLTDEQISQLLGDGTQQVLLTNQTVEIASVSYDFKNEIHESKLKFDSQDTTSFLGQGAFAKIFKATLKASDAYPNDRIVAVKMAEASNFSLDNLNILLNEVKFATYIGKHLNIVEFIGCCTTNIRKGKIFSVMEYCCNGSLKNYLMSQKDQQGKNTIIMHSNQTNELYLDFVPSTNILEFEIKAIEYFNKWAMEIASGMEHLASMKVIHVDLSARNVLLSQMTIKIADFGLSRMLNKTNVYERSNKGVIPVKWFSLEAMRDNVLSVESDVWAYGVTLWEMYSFCDEPYAQKNYAELKAFLESGQRLSRPEKANEEIFKEIKRCWDEVPTQRPTFTYLKEFFSKLTV